jgi:hypothetical protein
MDYATTMFPKPPQLFRGKGVTGDPASETYGKSYRDRQENTPLQIATPSTVERLSVLTDKRCPRGWPRFPMGMKLQV